MPILRVCYILILILIIRCSFSSTKGLNNHLRSRKHGEFIEIEQTPFENAIIKRMESLSISTFEELFAEVPDITDVIMKELRNQFPNLILPSSCLFCISKFRDVKENLTHMVETHSFFIPQVEQLSDFEGLVSHLAEKIHFCRMCLCCHPEKRYRSVEALRKHMIDKGHTMLGDDIEDISEFYLFGGDEFEDVDEEMDVIGEASHGQLQQLAIPTELEETYVLTISLIGSKDDYELELPSGRVVGHRNYRRYYAQYLRDPQMSTELSQRDAVRGRALTKERTQPPSAMGGKDAIDQRKFVQSLSKKMLKLSLNQNKFQPHFREQIL